MASPSVKTLPKPVQAVIFLVLGGTFGFLLSRAGASTYDFYPKLFLFEDLQLLWVIAVAAGIGVLGTLVIRLLKSRGRNPRAIIGAEPLNLAGKPWKKSLVPGSILFGVGWGLAGACPGTALVMLGEGKLGSLFTILGFFIGTYIYGVWQDSKTRKS
ncbi:DUF6691 family protein [Spirochaeta lutea]|uniref:DUF6691 family protein n=1 Tax=Spirochaeta lutea TaxID=1480694 RepID=UPI00068B039D|nr:DUF6691 family protein [Spirochaeta lutea]